MDKKTTLKQIKPYIAAVREHFDVGMVILYGSLSRGTARPDSDIDVAVVVDSLHEDLLDAEARLYRLRRSVDERIHPVLLESAHDRSGFLAELLVTGDVLYRKAPRRNLNP
jgi:uncharacterized protein